MDELVGDVEGAVVPEAGAVGWLPIDTAPKDGTVIWGRNQAMREPCKMSWGEYTASWGSTYENWRTEFTEDEFFPVLAGNLICN